MFKRELNYPLINITMFFLLFFLGVMASQYIFSFVTKILSVFLPIFIGFIVAYAINPFVVFLENYFSRTVSIFIVLFLLTLFLFFLIFTLFPILYQQIIGFTIQLFHIVNDISEKVSISSSSIHLFFTHFSNQLLKSLSTTMTFQFFGEFVSFVGDLFLGVISFFYFLFYMKKIRGVFKQFFSSRYPYFYQYLSSLDYKMKRYVKSLGILMIIQFIEYSFLFFIIGHPNWLILGICTGFFSILPYIGGVLVTILAIATAFTFSTSLFYLTLVVCFIFPMLDEYLISPKITGKSNHLSSILIVLLLTIGGLLGGFLGIILAVPIYIVIETTISYFLLDMKKSVKNVKNVL